MREKHIKIMVIKQLKKRFPHWRRLTRKEKKSLAEANNLRKNIERPINLLKHREGVEPVRVRSQAGVMAVVTFANMANLLLEIVATRKTKRKRKEKRQLELKLVA